MAASQTLFEKIWKAHLVAQPTGRSPILYIDLHLVHEVTSPQAFDGLRAAGRRCGNRCARWPRLITIFRLSRAARRSSILIAANQIDALQKNCREFGVRLFDMDSPEQGIVHVIGPELGLTQPGMTIVCGDSHTSTHGAFGALAFGIGTSEVEHVLATQMPAPAQTEDHADRRPRQAAGRRDRKRSGAWPSSVQIGTDGATGYVIEYAGDSRAGALDGRPHDALQHEHRGWGACGHGRAGRDDDSPT